MRRGSRGIQLDDFIRPGLPNQLGGVRGADELDFRESLPKTLNDAALPFGMQVQIQLINQHYPRRFIQRTITQMGIQDTNAPGDITKKPQQCSLAVAKVLEKDGLARRKIHVDLRVLNVEAQS